MSRTARSVVVLVSLLLWAGPAAAESVPKWIWNPVHQPGQVPPGACHFRGTFTLSQVTGAQLEIAADDTYEVYVNGHQLVRGQGWRHLARHDISKHLAKGKNVIAVKVVNKTQGDAGLVVRVTSKQGKVLLVTDRSWRTYTTSIPKWYWKRFATFRWKDAVERGPWGATKPWITTDQKPRRPQPPSAKETRPDGQVVLAGANETVLERTKPLLLRPLEALGIGRSRVQEPVGHTDPSPPARPRPNPAQAPHQGPKAIHNPFVVEGPARPAPQGAPKQAERLPRPAAEAPPNQTATPPRFSPREGFEVETVLGHTATGSLISATFNEFGQMLVGQEQGPLLLVLDVDQDGEFDQVKTYCEHVTNCQGILALSGMVFVIGEGPAGTGLYRLRDEDRDGVLEDVRALATFEVENDEHGPHALVLGPDAQLYLVIGNHTKLRGKFSKFSPRRHLYEGDLIPRQEDPSGHAMGVTVPGGAIVRTDITGEEFELVASGLRNAYDLAFNQEGELFTADSDMESDEGSPWYRPTSLYHVLPGSEFGWRSGWSKWPSYYHDRLPAVAELGRGSPTGMVFYEHEAYPDRFRGTAFVADWSRGRILTARLTPDGASYSAKTEEFLSGKPLNVTDLTVGPDGLLYFVTGGRKTAGGLYRVRWTRDTPAAAKPLGIDRALTAPQIHSSWGRQQVAAVRLEMGTRWAPAIQAAVQDTDRSPEARVQGLQVMQWIGPLPEASLLLDLSRDPHGEVRRQAARFLRALADDEAVALRLLELLSDPQPTVRRQAAESLVQSNRSVPFPYVKRLLSSRDRFEAWAGRRLLTLDHPRAWQRDALQSEDVRTFIQSSTALMVAWPSPARGKEVVQATMGRFQTYLSDSDFLDLLRVLQLSVLRGGLKPTDLPEATEALAEEFPANHALMNRELVRLLVHLQVSDIKSRYLDYLESDLEPADVVHVATHLRYLDTEWTEEEQQRLFPFLSPSKEVGSGVAGYLRNIASEMGKPSTAGEGPQRIGGMTPSEILAAVVKLPETLDADQIQALAELDRTLRGKDNVTRRLKVAILAVLARDGKDAAMAYLREVYDRDPSRRLAVTIGLAEAPSGPNFDYLVRSLPLLEDQLAREMIGKLLEVDQVPQGPEAYDQLIALGAELGAEGGDMAVRLLEKWQGYKHADQTPKWDVALKAWKNWLAQRYPDYQPTDRQLAKASSWTYDELVSYLSDDVLLEASAERGRQVFHQADCAKCHRHGGEGETLGPDLTGLAKRFRTKEILESIVHPSRVISDQYRSKTLVTDDGQAYTGIVGAGGQDAFMVLQPSGEKVRVPKDSVTETVASPISTMPKALIQAYSREQVADLIAFLQSDQLQLAEKPDGAEKK